MQIKSVRQASAAAVLIFVGTLAHSAPDRAHLAALSVAELKLAYLECDQLASTTFLDGGTAAQCSMVAQELIERGFDGKLEPLLEWWRGARKEFATPDEPDRKPAELL